MVTRSTILSTQKSVTKAAWLSALLLSALLLAGPQAVHGQDLWDMRVCADPNYYPASSDDQGGFELEIAAILADELHANLEIYWTGRGFEMVELHLRTGDCDVVMGASDGAAGMISTVPYYRSPYVFMYRTASGIDVESLDDPQLADLRIGTYAHGIPHRALVLAGVGDNVQLYLPTSEEGVPNLDAPLLDHLEKGDIDIALIYGPVAGNYAVQHPGEWQVVPVTPEFASLDLQMFRIWTIGVRSGDEALRDRLNIALANRWDDIQAVFEKYGVPLSPIPQPVVSRSEAGGAQ